MKNKAYILNEDVKQFPNDMLKIVSKWIEDELHKKMSQKEWQKMFDNIMVTAYKKNDLFFKSKIFLNDKNEGYLYPENINVNVLDKRDNSLGLGLSYEVNYFVLWKDCLKDIKRDLKHILPEQCECTFTEVETEKESFEQIHFTKIFNNRKKYLQEEIGKMDSEIRIIDSNIGKLMNSHE